MSRLAILLTCLAFTGCIAAAAPTPVESGATFTLAPGESASLVGTPVGVRFVSVTEDSRCPQDTTCIWAGEVKAAIEILERSKVARQLELKLGESAEGRGCRVTLLAVEPLPSSTARISRQGYRATLRIDKAS
ncbi:MAG TPA: hypothetical protein VJP84_04115 [Steroidobacteraceae bacterium]|jgi:hypothetical protein|nr:hypothetical protein [Steroidobacteraceae bacterium]